MAKFDIVNGLTYLDRSGWRADQNLPRLGYKVPRKNRTHVIMHHTVVNDSDTTPNLWESENEVVYRMRQLQKIRPDLGLDVPYNFVIFLMNTSPASIYVCEGRGEDRTGAHTKGHNTRGIGIAFQGNFESAVNMTYYTRLVSNFLGWLKYNPNGPGYGYYAPMVNLGKLAPYNRQVFCHSDFKATACPGNSVISVLSQFRF